MQKRGPISYFNKWILTFAAFLSMGMATEMQAQDESPCPPPDNAKAVKLYKQGIDKKKYGKRERVEFLQDAYELEPEYADVLFQLAEEIIKTARLDGKPYKPAAQYLEPLQRVCPDYNIYMYFYLGQIAYQEKQFKIAAEHLNKFLKDEDGVKKDADYNLAEEMAKTAEEYAFIYGEPVPFDPKCVEGVNTKADEYLAVISPDNQYMFFTRMVMEKKDPFDQLGKMPEPVEYFSRAMRGSEGFNEGEKLPPPFNMQGNYGGATITPDNRHLFVTICLDQSATVNCDIYTSDWVNGKWDSLRPMGDQINTRQGWEAQPSISADGKTLYFAGFRMDSRGMDLYKTEKQEDGTWGPAINLGAPINTDQHEKSPFLHSDSQTLYFSSDGHTGMGGFDIFMSKADDGSSWKKPVNLRHPINTPDNEVGFFVSTDGKYGYFASNALKGKSCAGGYDLYYFDLYKEARPEKVLFISGEVTASENSSLANTQVEVRNTSTNKISRFGVDSTDGRYVAIVAASADEDFVVSVKEPGKAIVSHLVSTKDLASATKTTLRSELKTIKPGAVYRINDINFGTNSSRIEPRSLPVLDELVGFMKENPKMKISVHGHTDDVGPDAENLLLSTDRAFSVMEYLQSKGISKDRVAFKGYGETQPILPNTSEENRAVNRRTEFKVIDF